MDNSYNDNIEDKLDDIFKEIDYKIYNDNSFLENEGKKLSSSLFLILFCFRLEIRFLETMEI